MGLSFGIISTSFADNPYALYINSAKKNYDAKQVNQSNDLQVQPESSTQKIFNMMNSIVTQTQRGHFSYVQISVDFSSSPFNIITKGMSKNTFSERLNQGKALDCGDTIPWDSSEVKKFEAGKTTGLHIDGTGSVCFSKDGSYYKLKGKLDNNLNITKCDYLDKERAKYLLVF